MRILIIYMSVADAWLLVLRCDDGRVPAPETPDAIRGQPQPAQEPAEPRAGDDPGVVTVASLYL